MPGSENGADHLREFETAMAGYDGDVAVLTVIIGQDALMTDATAYVSRYNVTWPVLLDSTGEFAASLPTGKPMRCWSWTVQGACPPRILQRKPTPNSGKR